MTHRTLGADSAAPSKAWLDGFFQFQLPRRRYATIADNYIQLNPGNFF